MGVGGHGHARLDSGAGAEEARPGPAHSPPGSASGCAAAGKHLQQSALGQGEMETQT